MGEGALRIMPISGKCTSISCLLRGMVIVVDNRDKVYFFIMTVLELPVESITEQ